MPNKKSSVTSRQSPAKAKNLKTKPQRSKAAVRRLEQPRYKSFHLSKRIKQPKSPLKGSFRLFVVSLRLMKQQWRLFLMVGIIYLLLTVVLVNGFGFDSELGDIKEALDGISKLATTLAIFGALLSSTGNATTEVAGAYQSILLIIGSLAVIWALRQSAGVGKKQVRAKDAFYNGMTPLVPFLLILVVIGLQLIPIIVAGFLYGVVYGGGLAATPPEQVIWGLLLFCLGLLSLYMVTSSIFALYIVTLPNVTPMSALRSARDLVRHRRWIVMRKVVFLPFMLFLLAASILVPAIIISTTLAQWLFLMFGIVVLPVVHSYMYTLYRELIKE